MIRVLLVLLHYSLALNKQDQIIWFMDNELLISLSQISVQLSCPISGTDSGKRMRYIGTMK